LVSDREKRESEGSSIKKYSERRALLAEPSRREERKTELTIHAGCATKTRSSKDASFESAERSGAQLFSKREGRAAGDGGKTRATWGQGIYK